MPLTWDVEAVEDWQDITQNDNEWAKTEAIIFTLIVTGTPDITEENWEEVFIRINMWERASGTMMLDGDGNNLYMKPEWIRRRVGLKTNASTLTKREFKERVAKALRDRATGKLRCS